METKDNCTILLEKMTQKVRCFKFKSSVLDRELALHEDTEDKHKSSITDVKTGNRLLTINNRVKDVKEVDIQNELQKFINHYSIDCIKNRLEELDKVPMEQRIKKAKK